MFANSLIVVYFCLMGASLLLGFASTFFSQPRTIWKAVGLWGLGLGAGVAGTILSFYVLKLRGQEQAALRAAGISVPKTNDMIGFVQVLLASYGLMFFAALLVLNGIGFVVGMIYDRRDRKAR